MSRVGGLTALAASILAVAPALATPPIGRIENEVEAVFQAAARGGPAGLEASLAACWEASAGYGVGALAPCETRERAALALIAVLRERLGPVGGAGLTEAASEARINEAYGDRGAARSDETEDAGLLAYAVARRTNPALARAPALADIEDAVAEAARLARREGPAALGNAVAACWVRLALAPPNDPDDAAEAAWRCRLRAQVGELLATRDPAFIGLVTEPEAEEKRGRLLRALTGADAAAEDATARAAARLLEAE